MRAGLFPGQGLEPKLVLDALEPGHHLLQQATEVLGYDPRRKVEQVARRSRPLLPTDLAQPAIFVAGSIAFEAAVESGTRFDFLVGHSLGEYTALVAAGAIPFSHGLKLVATRGEAMRRAASLTDGGMAAVLGLSIERIDQICADTGLTLANDNSPKQVVLSGAREALAIGAELVRGQGGRAILLPVDGAYHTTAMEAAIVELRDALERTDVRNPRINVLSNVSATPYRAPGEIRRLLLEQLTSRIRFRELIEWLVARGISDFVDLGPGRVVSGLATATAHTVRVAARA